MARGGSNLRGGYQPNMRFVNEDARAAELLTLHRTRHLFIRQQTAIINSIRAHVAEFGIRSAARRDGVEHWSKLSPMQGTHGFPK